MGAWCKAVWHWLLKAAPWLLLFATTVMSLGGLLGRLYWRFDILNHPRPQYVMAAAFLSGFYLLQQRYKLAKIALLVLAVNLCVVLPHLWPNSQKQEQTEQGKQRKPLRVATINVLQGNKQYALLEERLKEWQPDIVAFQECGHLWRFEMLKWKALYPYQTLEQKDGGHFELVVLSKNPWKKIETIKLGSGMYSYGLALEYEMEGKTFWVMTLHSAKPTESSQIKHVKTMNETIASWLDEKRKAGQPAIIMGDFNCTPWSIYYRDLINSTELNAASRGRPFMATWNVWYPFQLMIDHVLFTEDWKLKQTHISRGFGSDHRPVIVDLEWNS